MIPNRSELGLESLLPVKQAHWFGRWVPESLVVIEFDSFSSLTGVL